MATSFTDIIREIEGTTNDAAQRAQEIARDTNRETLPVRVFRQGPRVMLAGVLPVRVLVRILAYNASVKGTTAGKAVSASNRPMIPEHVETIARYLKTALESNEKYILPSLTLNATAGVEVYVPRGMGNGFAVLPEEQRLYIVDGQHRFEAVKRVAQGLRGSEAGDRFMSDGVPVMITVEEDIAQIHQDFADAGKTKPLPPSLLAVYDIRLPGNRAVHQIVEGVRLFKDRIDATSTTLSKNSPYLFLVNQVRQFVKGSLTGNAAIKDDAFGVQSQNALADHKAFQRWVDSRVLFLDLLTELIPEWNVIADLPKPQGPEGPRVLAKMKELRDHKPVSLSAAALNALGLVSYSVLKDLDLGKPSEVERQIRRSLEPLRTVSWDRTAELWKDNLVQGSRIGNQAPAVRSAHKALLEVLAGKHQFAPVAG